MKSTMSIDRRGCRIWCNNAGELHREDGPAWEGANGSKSWYLNGVLHREDGPAWEGADGTKKWYWNNVLHREDGPAVEWSDGQKEWWLNSNRYSTPEDWAREVLKLNGKEINEEQVNNLVGNTLRPYLNESL